jgi:hypothetical protein
MTHELKTWPPYFGQVLSGEKTFEVRKNDRDYKVGDELHLREWDPSLEEYSGRELRRTITFVLLGSRFGIEEGTCVLALAPATPVLPRDSATKGEGETPRFAVSIVMLKHGGWDAKMNVQNILSIVTGSRSKEEAFGHAMKHASESLPEHAYHVHTVTEIPAPPASQHGDEWAELGQKLLSVIEAEMDGYEDTYLEMKGVVAAIHARVMITLSEHTPKPPVAQSGEVREAVYRAVGKHFPSPGSITMAVEWNIAARELESAILTAITPFLATSVVAKNPLPAHLTRPVPCRGDGSLTSDNA